MKSSCLILLPIAGAFYLTMALAQGPNKNTAQAQKSGAAKLYGQNCASCHGAAGEGSDACCKMMSGPILLSAVLRMNAKTFLDEVRHVGETNMCAGNLLDLSSADVEAIRNYLLEVSKQARPN